MLATLDAVIATLAAIAGEPGEELLARPSQRSFSMGTQLLKRRADVLMKRKGLITILAVLKKNTLY